MERACVLFFVIVISDSIPVSNAEYNTNMKVISIKIVKVIVYISNKNIKW